VICWERTARFSFWSLALGPCVLCVKGNKPIRLWHVEAPTFSQDSRLTDGGVVVSLTRQPPFTPLKIPGTHFCYRLSRPQEGLGKLKKKLILSRLEPANFWTVAQCLNQLRYLVPHRPICTGEYFPLVKRPEHRADHSLLHSAKAEDEFMFVLSPLTHFYVVRSLTCSNDRPVREGAFVYQGEF
jgi:hypothetical protein